MILAKFASMIENNGVYEGKRILSRSCPLIYQGKIIHPLIENTAGWDGF